MTPARNRAELAKIHLLAKGAGLDDDAYRDLLQRLTGMRSAKDLDEGGRAKVLDHLSRLSGQQPGYQGKRPHNLRAKPELAKIEAFLAEAKRPWEYANAMAKHMYGVDEARWCSPDQLRGLIAALFRDAKRHDRRTE
jgi:phage gp16-like protein